MERKPKVRGKLKRYNIDFKKSVVLYAELQRSNTRAVQKYGISLSNIRRWRKNKMQLFNDSMPLQQRIAAANVASSSSSSTLPPQLQIPSASAIESRLQSQPLSPTKLKVTRQTTAKLSSGGLNSQKSENSGSSSEEVCLRWNSHHSNMQTAFPTLLQKEQYVDVTLMAEGKTIKCHRMILSSCSAYFEEVLDGIVANQHPVIILNNTPFWILKALIDFMYIGEVNIDQCQLPELLDVAELLKIKGLAGKSSSSESDKKENLTAKNKPTFKEIPLVNKPVVKKFRSPSPKVEEMSPINDPLELLEPTFQEETQNETLSPKLKDRQFHARKFLAKRLKKRKAMEQHESTPPPLFPVRRGTRSRPNVKMPRYYDYEDIVKPSGSQSSDVARPFSPINIKSEPMDEDEESGGTTKDDRPSPLLRQRETTETSCGLIIETRSLAVENNAVPLLKDKEAELSPSYCKIKIKSLSSLAELSPDESNDEGPPALEICAVNADQRVLEELNKEEMIDDLEEEDDDDDQARENEEDKEESKD